MASFQSQTNACRTGKITIHRHRWSRKYNERKGQHFSTSKVRGKLAFPNLKLYYQASCLSRITEWTKSPNSRISAKGLYRSQPH